jgi:hypothetical protein
MKMDDIEGLGRQQPPQAESRANIECIADREWMASDSRESGAAAQFTVGVAQQFSSMTAMHQLASEAQHLGFATRERDLGINPEDSQLYRSV